MTLQNLLLLSALLFVIGLFGVLTRKNLVAILMSVEIMLNAASLNFVALSAYFADATLAGHIFAVFIIAIAAAEVVVGLAILLAIFRTSGEVSVDTIRKMRF